MSDSPAFALVAEALEELTDLKGIEARGTVRIAVKTAGLSASDVSRDQMATVCERVLAQELTARGVENASNTVGELAIRLKSLVQGAPSASPEASLRRLWKD